MNDLKINVFNKTVELLNYWVKMLKFSIQIIFRLLNNAKYPEIASAISAA